MNYKKIYLKYFDLGEQDFVPCEACGSEAVDVHHIHGRVGDESDNIKNLMALCRKHHTMAHESISKSEMQLIHNYYLSGQRKQYLK
jgi:predicted restriction endonuclease